MTNSLVATATSDTSSAFGGAYLLQDGADIAHALESGSWVEGGIALFTTALDGIGMVIDPIGTLIANGLGWVIEHVEPLRGWLEELTGNAAEVSAFAKTWSNASGHLNQVGGDLSRRLADLDGLSGATIDAYTAHVQDLAAHINGSAQWAGAVGSALEVASTLVKAVYELVRDALSQVVGTAISAALTATVTVGFGIPWAIGQIATKVAAVVGRIGKFVTSLLRSMREVIPLLSRLCTMVEKVMGRLRGRLTGSSSAAPAGPHHAPRIPTREEFDRYVDSLPTRDPNYGSAEAREFQRRVAGDQEYFIMSGDDEIWADGLRYDPETGGIAVEAKFVDKPGQSSIHEGTAPPFLNGPLHRIDDEIRRYATVIADESTPLTSLDVIVSTPKAQEFLGGRIEGVMQSLESQGVRVPYRVIVEGEATR